MEELVPLAPVLTVLVGAFGAVLALGTLLRAVFEYVNQNRLKRFEKFQEMSRRFDENAVISEICRLLMDDASELASISKYNKEVLICFMEEIAVLHNSRILPKALIVNAFGYYATKVDASEHFWTNLNRHEKFYSLFVSFCEEMRTAQNDMFASEIRRIRI
jgi:hypothetical protein